ncbi:MAG TPA: M48 family metallopeptidase [Candidatus Acidoferrales bacterium]|jgi:predicted Zn-dependent protease|nr:M48 family metallopeptidase [Candidatus Acidoferrales bacterium]
MRRLCNGIIGILVVLVLAAPAGFAAQSQSQPQTQQQPTTTGQQSQTQSQQQPTATDAGQQPQTEDQTPASDEDATVKGVKPGSEKDVNAVGNRGVGKGVNLYSLQREIALGKQAAMEVEKTAKMINDPVVTEYVNRVGQNLVRNSDAKVPFTIKVIDSDEINAFALPGGFFYVNSGLILRADEEAELAGVMGHEIAHVAARHGTKTATKGEIMQLATIPVMILVPYGMAGYGIYEGLNLAIPMSYLKFDRDNEREADFLGLQYMYKAGYDPNAFVSFFEKIEAEERRHPGSIPKIFATHPPTPDRVQKAQEEIATILPARDEYIVTTSEFDLVKARLRRIENKNKLDDKKSAGDKPTLRTRTENPPPSTTGTQQPQAGGGSTDDSDPDRPVLKKRTDDGTNPN